MSRRQSRSAAWTSAACAFLCLTLLVWSIAKPSWINRGQQTAGIIAGTIEIAWSSGTLVRSVKAWSIDDPSSLQGGYDIVLKGSRSSWRPHITDLRNALPPSMSLTVLNIPLWPWVSLFGGLAGLLWWRSCKAFPGHCRKCGYDLAGLATEMCPECGTLRTGLAARLLHTLRSNTTERRHILIAR